MLISGRVCGEVVGSLDVADTVTYVNSVHFMKRCLLQVHSESIMATPYRTYKATLVECDLTVGRRGIELPLARG